MSGREGGKEEERERERERGNIPQYKLKRTISHTEQHNQSIEAKS